MSNVLPVESKRELDRRARWRGIFVIGCAGTAAAFLAMLSLLPTFISIATARAALDAPTDAEAGSAREFQGQARRAQSLVDAIEPVVLATTSPATMLSDALEALPPGMTVTAITFEASKRALVISGAAPRRESVNAFRDALQGSGKFKNIDVPVGALAGTQEGRYSVTLTSL